MRRTLSLLVAVLVVGCGLDRAGDGDAIDPNRKYETMPSPTEPPPEQAANPARAPRVGAGIVALYTFNEGNGSEVFDVSGRIPSTPLKIATPPSAAWESGFLRLKAPNLLLPSNDSSSVIGALKTANAFTVEAWITPATTTTILSRLVGSGPNGILANFNLGADDTSLFVSLRTSMGDPQTVTALSMVFSAKLMHVVGTRGSDGATKLYVDGSERASLMLPGNLSTWDTSYPLTVANAPSNDRPWLGDIHLVALYNRALGPSEVKQNFDADP